MIAFAKYLFTLIIFFTIATSAVKSAVLDRNENCEKAFDCILNLEFNLARNLIENEKDQNPENLYANYLLNILFYINYLTEDNQENFNVAEAALKENIEAFEKNKIKTPAYKVLLADLYFQKSVLNGIAENRFSAAVNMYKSYHLVRDNRDEYPYYTDNEKLLGIFNITLGPVLSNYSFLGVLLNIDTNYEEGLRIAGKYYNYAKTDNVKLKEFLLYYGVAFKQAGTNQSSMYDKFKENESVVFESPLLVYTYAEFADILKKNDKAKSIIRKFEESDNYKPFHLLNYLKGKLLIQSLNNEGETYLKDYIQNFEGQIFLKQSCLYLAWKNYIDGDTADLNHYLGLIESLGSTKNSKDRHALEESKDTANWHKGLLTARIYFDGGYFKRALTCMDNIDRQTLDNDVQTTEYFYRFARIYYEKGNFANAEKYYRACIEKGKNQPVYFAANSAYLLAKMYQKDGEKTKAEDMIDVCLGISGYDYEREIKYKARQLQRGL